jgi:hypothetical protein
MGLSTGFLLAGGKFINDALRLTGFSTIPAIGGGRGAVRGRDLCRWLHSRTVFQAGWSMSKAALKAAFREQFREAPDRG